MGHRLTDSDVKRILNECQQMIIKYRINSHYKGHIVKWLRDNAVPVASNPDIPKGVALREFIANSCNDTLKEFKNRCRYTLTHCYGAYGYYLEYVLIECMREAFNKMRRDDTDTFNGWLNRMKPLKR